MLWGKYWELVYDQRTRCRQSKCADGLGLLIVVSLQFCSQSEIR